MANTKKKSENSSSSKRRAKPLAAKAGFTKTPRRYGCGGKLK